jgi:predicted dehydrogenase
VFVSNRRDLAYPTHASIGNALEAHDIGYVVVANETSRHREAMDALVSTDYHGAVLIEKPAALGADDVDLTQFSRVGVAYNLRFHPLLQQLKTRLGSERILSVEAYAGQLLETWRPDRAVSEQYSAHHSRGGGVLRDLSHELDYLAWMFGRTVGVFALGGRIANVTVDSDDSWSIVARTERVPQVALQLNYLDRPGSRFIRVVTEKNTFHADVLTATLTVTSDSHTQVESFPIDRDETYRRMHLDMMGESPASVTTVTEARDIDHLILGIESSASEGKWVTT